MSPRALYRAYLGHLRQIPDPHVWGVLVPHFRELLHTAHTPVAESSAAAQARQKHATKRVKDEYRRLQAAVASHPHALLRLLEQCYGQRGRIKWQLVQSVTLSSPTPKEDWHPFALEREPNPEVRYPPATYQPVPLPLRPLTRRMPATPTAARARTVVPKVMQRKAAKNEWAFQWKRVKVPLVLPGGGRTGWEGKGVVEGLQQLAGRGQVHLPPPSRRSGIAPTTYERGQLPTFHNLPPSLQACFPRRPVKHQVVDYPRPRAALTRQNPSTWGEPRDFTARSLRRTYKRLWDSLPWVRERQGKWVACTYEDMVGEPKPHHVLSEATEEELKWLE